MSADDTLIAAVKHTLACCRAEKAQARRDIARASSLLGDAQHDLSRALSGEQACKDRLAELRETCTP